MLRASDRASTVLPTPGTSSISTCPRPSKSRTVQQPPPTEPTPRAAGERVHRHYATRALPPPAPTVLHSGMTVPRYFAMHAMGAIFPMTAAVIIFGWRGLGVLCVIV